MGKLGELRHAADWKFVLTAAVLCLVTIAAVALGGNEADPAEDVNLAMSPARLRAIEYRQNLEEERAAAREGRPAEKVAR